MNTEQIYGFTLLLLVIIMNKNYSKEEMKQWGWWRIGLEAVRDIIQMAMFYQACMYLIIPTIAEMFL